MNNEIHINHITKRYGDVEALRNLSLEIGSGELFGLIGPDLPRPDSRGELELLRYGLQYDDRGELRSGTGYL